MGIDAAADAAAEAVVVVLELLCLLEKKHNLPKVNSKRKLCKLSLFIFHTPWRKFSFHQSVQNGGLVRTSSETGYWWKYLA